MISGILRQHISHSIFKIWRFPSWIILITIYGSYLLVIHLTPVSVARKYFSSVILLMAVAMCLLAGIIIIPVMGMNGRTQMIVHYA